MQAGSVKKPTPRPPLGPCGQAPPPGPTKMSSLHRGVAQPQPACAASCSGRQPVTPMPPCAAQQHHRSHAAAPSRAGGLQPGQRQRCRSSPLDDPEPQNVEELRKKYFKQQQQTGGTPGEDAEPKPDQLAGGASALEALDKVNPYELGRQARAAFNDVWSALSRVSSPTRSFVIDEELEVGADADFAAPQAAFTTVLVLGATGRVGRILVRKLLLRGYTVKALVRNKSGADALPGAVELVEGDVGDLGTCQKAVKGVSKVGAFAWSREFGGGGGRPGSCLPPG